MKKIILLICFVAAFSFMTVINFAEEAVQKTTIGYECAPNAIKCGSNGVEKCDEYGNKWDLIEECDFKCFQNTGVYCISREQYNQMRLTLLIKRLSIALIPILLIIKLFFKPNIFKVKHNEK